MARMHSKKRGKAKSRKPVLEAVTPPQMPKGEIEALIVGYAKQGRSPAAIGVLLKREHSVMYPKNALGRSITEVLKEKGSASKIPYDLLDLMKKAVNMHSHLATNGQDVHNRVQLQRVESKIWRLTKYYIRNGSLPGSWRYNPKTAELMIKGTG